MDEFTMPEDNIRVLLRQSQVSLIFETAFSFPHGPAFSIRRQQCGEALIR